MLGALWMAYVSVDPRWRALSLLGDTRQDKEITAQSLKHFNGVNLGAALGPPNKVHFAE